MSITTFVKYSLNRLLSSANVRLETLTLERAEEQRLRQLAAAGYFDERVFPLPQSFDKIQCDPIVREVISHADRFRELDVGRPGLSAFSFDNQYFTSPDAEVFYAVIHRFRPSTVIEVGSGNSTKLARQAIVDCGANTRLISIDPDPRTTIEDVVDVCLRRPVESLDPMWLAGQLKSRDVLFIDSSHMLRPCGDVAFLYLRLLPLLREGVLIHIHDIFAPYEYPQEWVVEERWSWNEQYLVQALLDFTDQFEIIWAGYFLQRTMPDFATIFPRAEARRASSLWLRKRA